MNEFTKQKIKIARARYNIMFMAVLSIINMLLIAKGNTLTMPFSSSIATYATVIGINSSKENGNDSFRIFGFCIAGFVILTLLLCHLFSKSKPFWLLVAFSLIIADTAVLLTFAFVAGSFQVLTILDFALHVLTLLYVFGAIKAHSDLIKLHNANRNITNTPVENTPEETTESQLNTASHTEPEEEEEEEEEDLTKPIGKYEGEYSNAVLCGEYANLKINVIIEDSSALLIINGYICDSLNVAFFDEYTLRAIVNGIDFTFGFKRTYSGEVMYLYADDELLDSLGRN